jgi:hypothetical protein
LSTMDTPNPADRTDAAPPRAVLARQTSQSCD